MINASKRPNGKSKVRSVRSGTTGTSSSTRSLGKDKEMRSKRGGLQGIRRCNERIRVGRNEMRGIYCTYIHRHTHSLTRILDQTDSSAYPLSSLSYSFARSTFEPYGTVLMHIGYHHPKQLRRNRPCWYRRLQQQQHLNFPLAVGSNPKSQWRN